MQYRFEDHYSPEELSHFVEKLNTLYSDFSRWCVTDAQKPHQDLFGQQIQHGEKYYRRRVGPGFDDVVKLAASSMSTVLCTLFDYNAQLENIVDQLISARDERMRQFIPKLPTDSPKV